MGICVVGGRVCGDLGEEGEVVFLLDFNFVYMSLCTCLKGGGGLGLGFHKSRRVHFWCFGTDRDGKKILEA